MKGGSLARKTTRDDGCGRSKMNRKRILTGRCEKMEAESNAPMHVRDNRLEKSLLAVAALLLLLLAVDDDSAPPPDELAALS